MCGTPTVGAPPCSCESRPQRPISNFAQFPVSPSPSPAASAGPARTRDRAVGVETRGNGRWRYGRHMRNEQAGVAMGSAGAHTILPRVVRTAGVPGVNAQQPILPAQRPTSRRPAVLDSGLGECKA